jgi:hypothetical protein
MMILGMRPKMFRQVADPIRQQCDLHLGGSGIVFMGTKRLNNRRLRFTRRRHDYSPHFPSDTVSIALGFVDA